MSAPDPGRRRAGGRPPAAEGQLRGQAVNVRLNNEESAAWQAAARAAGHRRTAAWVREIVNATLTAENRSGGMDRDAAAAVPASRGAPSGPGLAPEALELVAQLRRIGNNLNQVARYMNGVGEVPSYAARLMPLVRDALVAVRDAAGGDQERVPEE